ncbi:MAG: ABC transporter permease [Thermoplasmata archaeon]|nr:ABC transporter permease [Thermoplasmata archaeon]
MLPLKIAMRFLKSSRLQTILVVLGIAVGVSVQVFVGTLITSLQASLIDSTVGNSPHVTVENETGDAIMDWEPMVDQIISVPLVTDVTVVADGYAFTPVGGGVSPVLVRGFDLSTADGIYGLAGALYSGDLPVGGEAMIGRELAEASSLGPGDVMQVLFSNGTEADLEIAGLYDLKVSSINSAWVVTTLWTAQGLFDMGEGVSSIEVQVSDVFAADTVASDIESLLGPSGVTVDNWKAQNESLLSGLQGQSASSIMIQVFVMASVVIAIASVLAIKVVQKSRQIGILKAMGITDRAASLIFLFEGVILGGAGSVIGVSLGVGLLYSFTTFATNPDGSSLIDLYLDPAFVVGSGAIAVLASTLAAVIPARKSSRLSPVEVIRNG